MYGLINFPPVIQIEQIWRKELRSLIVAPSMSCSNDWETSAMPRTTLLTLVALFLTAQLSAQEAKRKTGIAFKIISGEENGSKAILDKRKASLLEKRGGKLQRHDW